MLNLRSHSHQRTLGLRSPPSWPHPWAIVARMPGRGAHKKTRAWAAAWVLAEPRGTPVLPWRGSIFSCPHTMTSPEGVTESAVISWEVGPLPMSWMLSLPPAESGALYFPDSHHCLSTFPTGSHHQELTYIHLFFHNSLKHDLLSGLVIFHPSQ